MKKNIIGLVLALLTLTTSGVLAQGVYINAIETGMNMPISKYEEWLKRTGFIPTVKYNAIAVGKAETMSAIYNTPLTTIVYEEQRQPIRIFCYMDTTQKLRAVDIYMTNPQKGEFENIQLSLIKSGWKLQSESVNQNEKYTRTYFKKKNIKLNITHADDNSFIIMSASTLSIYE